MLSYTISAKTDKNILEIAFKIDGINDDKIEIRLPAWRPGRYEIQNFAKNILYVKAFNNDGLIEIQKTTKDTWLIESGKENEITVKYAYYAHQMDAGGSWVDENIWYINFINCLMFIKGRMDEPCEINLNLPATYSIACGLDFKNNAAIANDYYELTDSPAMASPSLKHIEYYIGETIFNIWLSGGSAIDENQWAENFKKFSEVQAAMMDGFPFRQYHYLIHILSYKFYHGVEHRNSTVIVIGNELDENKNIIGFENIYKKDILGICSHELFHAWNICRIRPEEMLPYNLEKENYFNTGYIAEGITTYYGDLFLVRSGLWDCDEYLEELSKTLNRHFNISNNAHQSLLESSIDLWVDGYSNGIPNKKVSIYHKGALVALILDLEIRRVTKNNNSFDDVMVEMWEKFGQKGIGYIHLDFINIVAGFIGHDAAWAYEKLCLRGNNNLLNKLEDVMAFVGCEIQTLDFPLFEGGISVEIRKKINSTVIENENFNKWLNN